MLFFVVELAYFLTLSSFATYNMLGDRLATAIRTAALADVDDALAVVKNGLRM